jgi:hypothetical protein
MQYIIAIYDSNGNRIKICYKYKSLERSKNRYTNLINNNQVYYSKKYYIKNSVMKKVTFYLYLLKEKEEGDKSLIIRDDMGRLMKETFSDPNYTVLEKKEIYIEEKFIVVGYKKKLTFKEILRNVMLDDQNIKYVFYLLNKVIIENYDKIDIIVCKNRSEARRFHDTLFHFFKSNKIKRGAFMNEVKKVHRKKFYNLIRNKTKWKWDKIFKSTTRP